jgi:KaiC/GvpD/RAD55 family RecA-like ATPase
LTTETRGGKKDFSAFGVEEFIVDGVIMLYFTPPHRSIFVKKMRGTDHSKSIHPFEIKDRGIVVKPKDNVLWESIE